MNDEPTKDELGALLAGKFAGDDASIAEGMAVLDRRLRSYFLSQIRRYVAVREDAEDVWQNTLKAVWEHAGDIDFDGRWLGYITTLARHAAIDWTRRQNVRGGSSGQELGAPLDSFDLSGAPEEAIIRRETQAAGERLKALLGELPEPYRSVLDMRFSRGMKYREIAGELGLNISTVASHIFRGLKELRERSGVRYDDIF